MPDTKRADMIVHEQEPYNAEPPARPSSTTW